MSVQHFALSVFQHENPSNANDPANGFYVCYQPSTDGVTPSPGSDPIPAPTSMGASNPYPTEAAAKAFVDAKIAAQAAENSSVFDTSNDSTSTLVYGPVLV